MTSRIKKQTQPVAKKKATVASSSKRKVVSRTAVKKVCAGGCRVNLVGSPQVVITLGPFSGGVVYERMRKLMPSAAVRADRTVEIQLKTVSAVNNFASDVVSLIDTLRDIGAYDEAALVLETVASLVDKAAVLMYGTNMRQDDWAIVAAIVSKLSFAHVVEWSVRLGRMVVPMFGTIQSIQVETNWVRLCLRVLTDVGEKLEHFQIARVVTDQEKVRSGVVYEPYMSDAVGVGYAIKRWRDVSTVVDSAYKKLDGSGYRLDVDKQYGTFRVAKAVFEESQYNNQSGIWQDGVELGGGSFVVESLCDAVPRREDRNSLADIARSVAIQQPSSVHVRPHAVRTMVVTCINVDTCQRRYVHIESARRVSAATSPNVVISGRVSHWLDQVQTMGAIRPEGLKLVVLAGASGFGKTELAKTIFASVGRNYIRVSAGVVGLTIETLSKRLSVISNLADKLGAAILIDDADFLLSARLEDPYKYALFQATIEFIDNCSVPIVCTTNLATLDEAIISRTDHGIYVDYDAYICSSFPVVTSSQSGLSQVMLKAYILKYLTDTGIPHSMRESVAQQLVHGLYESRNNLDTLSPRELFRVVRLVLDAACSRLDINGILDAVRSDALADQILVYTDSWLHFKVAVSDKQKHKD